VPTTRPVITVPASIRVNATGSRGSESRAWCRARVLMMSPVICAWRSPVSSCAESRQVRVPTFSARHEREDDRKRRVLVWRLGDDEREQERGRAR
jgi:hypothetical protein